jgi:hypothetical protein
LAHGRAAGDIALFCVAALCLRSLSRHRRALVGQCAGRAIASVVRTLPVRHRRPYPDAVMKLALGQGCEIVFI